MDGAKVSTHCNEKITVSPKIAARIIAIKIVDHSSAAVYIVVCSLVTRVYETKRLFYCKILTKGELIFEFKNTVFK